MSIDITMSGSIQRFLLGGYGAGSPEALEVLDLMRSTVDHLDLTYLTLVSLKQTIILNSSYRKNRTGETWNLAGVVSEVIDRVNKTNANEAVSSSISSRSSSSGSKKGFNGPSNMPPGLVVDVICLRYRQPSSFPMNC